MAHAGVGVLLLEHFELAFYLPGTVMQHPFVFKKKPKCLSESIYNEMSVWTFDLQTAERDILRRQLFRHSILALPMISEHSAPPSLC